MIFHDFLLFAIIKYYIICQLFAYATLTRNNAITSDGNQRLKKKEKEKKDGCRFNKNENHTEK